MSRGVRLWLPCLAVAWLGCGNVKSSSAALDGAAGGDIDGTPVNPCAPERCLLFDDFQGPSLDPTVWATATSPGATVTQTGGRLILHLPAEANAYADVSSLLGFPVGSTFQASATFTAGQTHDHKGAGFASQRVDRQCDAGETEAAMFRGQDTDNYIEAKTGGVWACTLTIAHYPAGENQIRITRTASQVTFQINDAPFGPLTTDIPTALLPIRFSAYTFTTAPANPVEIVVDSVFVSHP